MSQGAKDLAAAVSARRHRMGLTQAQLAKRGGPSTETLRLIENGLRDSYGAKSLAKLETALGWKQGIATAILDGTAPTDPDEWVRYVTKEQLLERRPAARGEAEPEDFDAWREANMPEQGVPVRLLFDGEHTAELDAFRNQISVAMRPFTEAASSHLANVMSGLGPALTQLMPAPNALLGIQAALESIRPFAAEASRISAIVDEQGAVFRALREIAPPPIDLTQVLAPLGVGETMRALAIPPLKLSPELVEAFRFYDEHEEEIESRPWWHEDIHIVEAARRYRAEIEEEPTEEPAEPQTVVPDSIPSQAKVGEPTVAVEHEVVEGEVIFGPWGVVITEQRDVGDLDDLALASELFARLARRPRTADRDHQLEALRGLVNDLADERRAQDVREQPRLPGARRQLGP